MKRVALLTPYASPVPGGISTMVTGLREVLERHGQRVFLLAGAGKGDREAHSDLGLGISFISKAQSALDRLDVDIVHCHAHWYTLLVGSRYNLRKGGKRIVFSFHTTHYPHLGILFERLLRKADVLTFVSAAQLAQVRTALRLGGDLRILYPAINPRVVEPQRIVEWRAKFDLSNAFPVLVFVGPLDYPRKVEGVIDLIQAAKRVKETYPSTRLLIVGDGKLRKRVDAAAHDAGGTVIVTGFVEDPFPAFASADLYCHVSYQESFGIAVLEAMSVGCPVIIIRNAGISEIIQPPAGEVIDPNPSDLQAAIVRLASNSDLRKEMGATARESIAARHTWEARWPVLRQIYAIE